MIDRKLLAQHGLKWNPFSLQLPLEALQLTAPIDSFCRRVESLAREGGFALLTGVTGSGKSSALRLLADRLSSVPELRVGEISRPQSHVADFYRELGELFGLMLSPHNRWAGTKALRERWHAHIDSALYRPVLLLDEAQEMPPSVLNELRLISSVNLDSRVLLTVVLAGDQRLTERLRTEELLALGSRIRARLCLESLAPPTLAQSLRDSLERAGNSKLMTDALITTLADHAAGNHRVLMNLGAELLAAAAERNLAQLDEKLYFEIYALPASADSLQPGAAVRSRRSSR